MSLATSVKGYELHQRIGSGGFGEVYRAFQTAIGREVTVKIVLPHFANNPDFIRSFESEAQRVARLEHLHIVPLYDYWRDASGAYLVTRWMRGGSLRERLDEGPYALRDAVQLIEQIAAALDQAHRSGVVHRALKPTNILLDEEGNAYISDFGIGHHIRQPVHRNDGYQADDAHIRYLSPEQIRGQELTPRSDIYSLGVILYELLTGKPPFAGMTPEEHLQNPGIPAITSFLPDVNNAINRVLHKAYDPDPRRRYSSAPELASDLRQAASPLVDESEEHLLERLTMREHEILGQIVSGKSNREIAEELVVTLSTVKWYVRQIYQKLQVRSRVQAIVRARNLNLIQADTDVEPETAIIEADRSFAENPYKGLRAFQPVDAKDFFGRETLVSTLIDRLAEKTPFTRFLAVVGPSGSGKSSVVRAGLIPALWKGRLPGSEHWFSIEIVPGTHPLDELEIALARIATRTATNLRETLTRDSRGLVRAAQLILPEDDSELVILVDQLEELFTLVTDENIKQQFIALLYDAVTDPRSRVRVIVTLRADFYDRPLLYPKLGEMIQARMETVLPLTTDELHAAITKPAARVGAEYDAGLVARIIADVHAQPGGLPLLQYALTELFDRRESNHLTLNAYETMGGVMGALARRADDVYQEQNEAGRHSIEQLFLRLVVPGEKSIDTRRRVPRAELMAVAADEDIMEEIIDACAAYRLLTLDHDPSSRQPTVEVAHEALLTEWQRLRNWLSQSRYDIRQQRLLATAAAEWEAAGQESSYLLHGARLHHMQSWATMTRITLTPNERQYLEMSIEEDERQTTLERERQQRELQTQRELAQQQQRAANRLRYLVAGLAVFLIGAVILSIFALSAQNEAQIARDNEAVARAEAETSLRYTEAQRLGLEAISLAQAGEESDLVALLAVRSLQTDYTPQGDAALQQALKMPYPLAALRSDSTSANASVAVSPDESLIAVGKADGRVDIWDMQTYELLDHFEGNPLVEFLLDGDHIVTCNHFAPESPLVVYRLSTQERQTVPLPGMTGGPWAMLPLPDNETLVVSSNTGEIVLVDINTWTEKAAIKAHEYQIPDIAISPDGQLIATASGDFSIKLWRADTLELVETFRNRFGDFYVLVGFSPDGSLIAAGNAGGHVTIWNVNDPSVPLYYYEPHVEVTWGLEFSVDQTQIISAAKDIRVWDYRTGQNVRTPIFLPGGRANDFELLSNGKTALVTSLDNDTLWIYDLESQGQILSFPSDIQHNHVVFSPDSTHLAQATMNTVAVIDIDTGTIQSFAQDSFVNGIHFAYDGQSVYYGEVGVGIPHLDLHTGEIVDTLAEGFYFALNLDISPDGRYLATKDADGKLYIFDISTGELVLTKQYASPVDNMIYSPDGRYMLITPQEGTACLLDTQTWDPIWEYHLDWAYNDAAFSPDGRYFAIGGAGPLLRMWETETQEPVRDFIGHYDAIWSVEFTPDGHYLLSGSTDGTARLWDIETGDELRRFGPEDVVNHVTISPDGKYGLVVYGRTASVWPLSLQESIDILCDLITRDFTEQEREIYSIEGNNPTCPRLTSIRSPA